MDQIKGKYNEFSEYYRTNLMQYIAHFEPEHFEQYEKYIAAFSQYLCQKGTAYRYNLTYLTEQNIAFGQFLKDAHRNYIVMQQLLDTIKQTKTVCMFLQNRPKEAKNVQIQLNGFLQGNLANEIELANDFSISGAQGHPRDDYFSVSYEDRQRSGFVDSNSQKLDGLISKVLPLQEEREAD